MEKGLPINAKADERQVGGGRICGGVFSGRILRPELVRHKFSGSIFMNIFLITRAPLF